MRGVCRKISWRYFLPGWRWLSNETPGHRQLVSLLMASCSVTQSGPTLRLHGSTPGFPVLHYLPEFAQTNVHRAGDAVQSSHPLSPPFSSCLQSFPALCLFVQDLTSSTRPLGTQIVKSNTLWIPCRASTSRTSMVVDFQSCLGWNFGDSANISVFTIAVGVCSLVCVVRLFHGMSCGALTHPSSFISYDTMPRFQHDDFLSDFKSMTIWAGTTHPLWYLHAKWLQLYLTLCDAMDCSPPGSSVHGILQARILEWIAMPSSRDSSRPRDQIHVSSLAGRLFTTKAPSKVKSGNRVPFESPYINRCAFAAGVGCHYYSPWEGSLFTWRWPVYGLNNYTSSLGWEWCWLHMPYCLFLTMLDPVMYAVWTEYSWNWMKLCTPLRFSLYTVDRQGGLCQCHLF